jgi:hypothetical protein
MVHGMKVFLAAPYCQLMNWDTGEIIEEWRVRFDELRRDIIDSGAEVFSAHHNEARGVKWMTP